MKLEKGIAILNATQQAKKTETHLSDIDARALLAVTLVFLILLLSVPLSKPDLLIWFAIYPIVMSPLIHEKYGFILRKSFYILPFVILIGIFNPIYETSPGMLIGDYIISRGWLTFTSLIIRALLSFQALIILIYSTGFINIVHSLNRLGCPNVMSMQLLMLYRYLGLLMDEALNMHRARVARGYGRKSYPIKMWVVLLGTLFLRTVDRAKHIKMAMEARGFNGIIHIGEIKKWQVADSVYCLVWILVLLFIRFFNLPDFFVSITGMR